LGGYLWCGKRRAGIVEREWKGSHPFVQGVLMPDWLVQVLIQYPIVLIVGLVAWYAHLKVERVMEVRVKREEALHTTMIEKLEKAQEEAVAEVKSERKN
jgi:hypothetical protein